MTPTNADIQNLINDLHSDETKTRQEAATALGHGKDRALLPHLINALQDTMPDVRAAAISAIAEISAATGDATTVPDLLALLDDYAEARLQSAHALVCDFAAQALLMTETDTAIDAVQAWQDRAEPQLRPFRIRQLIKQLNTRDPDTQNETLMALHAYGAEAVPPLLEALQNAQLPIQRQAARALGDIRAASAIQPLIAALAAEDIGLWSQATAALAKIGAATVADLRQAMQAEDEQVKIGAALALWRVRRDEAAFKWVLIAMQHDELVIRGSAISSMWLQPDGRAVATLSMALNNEADAMMQKYILQALQFIGTSQAQAVMANWLRDNPIG